MNKMKVWFLVFIVIIISFQANPVKAYTAVNHSLSLQNLPNSFSSVGFGSNIDMQVWTIKAAALGLCGV